MSKIITLFFLIAFSLPGNSLSAQNNGDNWTISAIPSSIRIDPTSNEIIENRFPVRSYSGVSILTKNWVYDGRKVALYGARGEYVSFQVVLTNRTGKPLKGIDISIAPFASNNNVAWKVSPELFLEWSVEVKTPSTGYSKATLGKGWYPDALIPMKFIQQGATSPAKSWVYPLQLPDFNNRIENQVSQIFWIDQYIPIDATGGTYTTQVSVIIGGITKIIPVELSVWNFAIPNKNHLKASLQHEGFVSQMDEKSELQVYQLMKRKYSHNPEPRQYLPSAYFPEFYQ